MKPRDLVAALNEAPEDLPAKLERKILSLGKGAISTLRRMLKPPAGDRSPQGSGDLHAIRLLAQLSAVEAVPDILAALERAGAEGRLTKAAAEALETFGTAALEPLLASACQERPFLIARAEILAKMGVRDPRILECLIELAKRHPEMADHLATYGDPAAIPALSELLDRVDVRAKGFFFSEAVTLAQTIEDLGGELSPEQRAKKALEEGLRDDHQRKILSMLQGQDQEGALRELLSMLQGGQP